jgi:hypothetical protein
MCRQRATQQSRKSNHEWRTANGRFPEITDRPLASSHESHRTATCVRQPQNKFLRPDYRVLKRADQSRNPAHRFRDPTQRFPEGENRKIAFERRFLGAELQFLDPERRFIGPEHRVLDPEHEFLEAEMRIFDGLRRASQSG